MLSSMNTPISSQPDPNQPGYYSYLLRLWQTPQGWRASLDEAHTSKRLGFASLEQLFAYVIAVTERDAGTNRT